MLKPLFWSASESGVQFAQAGGRELTGKLARTLLVTIVICLMIYGLAIFPWSAAARKVLVLNNWLMTHRIWFFVPMISSSFGMLLVRNTLLTVGDLRTAWQDQSGERIRQAEVRLGVLSAWKDRIFVAMVLYYLVLAFFCPVLTNVFEVEVQIIPTLVALAGPLLVVPLVCWPLATLGGYSAGDAIDNRYLIENATTGLSLSNLSLVSNIYGFEQRRPRQA